MNVQTQALLITAFISLIFALLVWTRKERSRTTLPFSLCNLFLFIHAASYVGLKLSGENLFLRTHIAAAVFLAPAYLYLMYSYLFQPNRVVDGLLVSLFGFAAVFAVTAFVPSVDAALHFLALYPPAERPVREATTTLLIAAVMLVMALVRILRERQSFSRRRYLGLFAATLLTAIALSFSRLMGGGPGGPIALVLYHYYLYQTLVRFQSFSVARMVGRLAVLTFSAVFLAIVYGLFFFFMRPFPIFFIFHTIAAAFILMIIYDPFLAGLGTKAREFVIRGRGEGRRTIERLVDDISRQWTLEQIVTFLSVHVPQALDLPSAVLYPSAEGGGFERASPGETGLERVPAELAETIADVAVEPVNLDRLLQQSSEGYPGQERERLLELIEFVDACQGRWLVPLRYRNDLVGVFIPGESSAADIGGEAETILRILADQAAVRLVNARIFQRLRSQDRLATLGEMAASLAHEIRNPLGSMKGAAQYLLDEDLPKDNREFVEIILAEAERLNDVLTRFWITRGRSASRARTSISTIWSAGLWRSSRKAIFPKVLR
ncbi:MAG: hypothetical protein M5R36_22475 [Deltaproteobacteria bacterium]|nr:hypothetical protein [Deltaproteobacteria bacterium]